MVQLKGVLDAGGRWISLSRRDVALAAVLCLADSVVFSGLSVGRGGSVVILYALAGYVPLVWRQRAPVPVFFALLFHYLGAAVWLPDYRPTLGLVAALYTIAVNLDRRNSGMALVAALITTTAGAIDQELRTNPGVDPRLIVAILVIPYTMFSGGAWAFGRWVRASRSRIEILERRRQRAQQAAAEAITAERARIARELHDIVSHSVSVMVLQAAGARRVLASDSTRVEQALAHIEAVGKESMVELRRLLGVLRDGALADQPEDGELGPQPGLADLAKLLDEIRLSGLPVRLDVEGRAARLDLSVDLSAYRIMQEALTNSLKHGGPATTATVLLVWTPDLLIIEVTDDGTASTRDPTLSTKYGLLGLRERARAVGGHLDAGPEAGGGFRVSATLPVAESWHPDTRQTAHQPGS